MALNNERQCILPFHIISVHSSSSSSNSRGSRTKNNHGDYASSALIIVIFTRILHQITHPKRGYLPKPVVSTYHSKVRFCLVPHCSHQALRHTASLKSHQPTSLPLSSHPTFSAQSRWLPLFVPRPDQGTVKLAVAAVGRDSRGHFGRGILG